MVDVLNPDLYKRLCQRFGAVKVHNPGEAMQGTYLSNFGQSRWQITHWGENYAVNCFMCNDTRHRLCINHRWGAGPPSNNTNNNKFWHLATCYNEGCEKLSGFFNELRNRLYGVFHGGPAVIIRPGKEVVIKKVELPGLTINLNELPIDHTATKYLLNRGFDTFELAEKYGVAYCYGSDTWPILTGRLIIPFYDNERNLIGWQARLIGDNKSKDNPKYFSMKGSWINGCLYNYDRAINSRILILTEGVTDVWRLNTDGAVALLCKNLKPAHEKLVAPFETIIVLLDADAGNAGEKICSKLKNKNVVNVKLPEGKDPGDMDREQLFELIWKSVEEQGVSV